MSPRTLAQVLEDLPPLVAPTDTWNDTSYLLAAVIFTALNQPESVALVYDIVEKHVPDDNAKLKVVQRVRDAVFKSLAIVGTPRSINSLVKLGERLPDTITQQLPKTPMRYFRQESSLEAIRERGQQMYDTIYDQHATAVKQKLEMAYPDMWAYALDAYGNVYSDVTYIDAKETSFIILVALMCYQCHSQIKYHFYGAIHNGATHDQLRTLQVIVNTITSFFGHSISTLPFEEKKSA